MLVFSECSDTRKCYAKKKTLFGLKAAGASCAAAGKERELLAQGRHVRLSDPVKGGALAGSIAASLQVIDLRL